MSMTKIRTEGGARMMRVFLREIAGFAVCMAIIFPLVWLALKTYFGD
jgi:hypothetical protein